MSGRRALLVAAAVPLALGVLLVVWTAAALLIYPNEYVRRILMWRETDVGDYLHHFPSRDLNASIEPFHFETVPDEEGVREAFESVLGVDDLEGFLAEHDTQALIVIQHDRVVYEQYFNGWRRDSLLTSFSVAKSFTSTLVGMAIERGYIGGLDDPITSYLPELLERDHRFERITIRHLLTMSSGLEFKEERWFLFNGDGALTSYYPDQRKASLEFTHIDGAPGETFLYNKYHPQLLGQILERTTGMSVTQLTQRWLWDPLGMEFDGSWSLDSEESGFEKMETGLNARAIDYAKLGRLFLHEGNWDGRTLVSSGWAALASGRDPAGRAPAYADDSFYGLMWWGVPRGDGIPDFAAEGDHGQYVYVSPEHDMVIVRNGVEYGLAPDMWIDAFRRFAETY